MSSISHTPPFEMPSEVTSGDANPFFMWFPDQLPETITPPSEGARRYLAAVAELEWLKSFEEITNGDLLRLFCRVALTTFVVGAAIYICANTIIANAALSALATSVASIATLHFS